MNEYLLFIEAWPYLMPLGRLKKQLIMLFGITPELYQIHV